MEVESILLTAGQDTTLISSLGAELKGWQTSGGVQWIWPGDRIWNRSAPFLFPIVGRMYDNSIAIKNKTYRLQQHGFLRDQVFKIESSSQNSVILSFYSNDHTIECYPFHFRAEVRYELHENSLEVIFKIHNLDLETMPFSFGWHPAFCIDPELKNNEVTFSFETAGEMARVVDGLLVRQQPINLPNTTGVPLSAFERYSDAFVFMNHNFKKVMLQNSRGCIKIFAQEGFPHLGLWGDSSNHFICLEPWWGYGDGLELYTSIYDRPGMLLLQPNEIWERRFQLEKNV